MFVLFLGLISLIRTIITSFKDPRVRVLGIVVFLLLSSGTFVFSKVEGWSFFDSFYFTVITLATVGYGDFTPHTVLGKILVIVYIFLGVGTLVSFFTVLSENIGKIRKSRQ